VYRTLLSLVVLIGLVTASACTDREAERAAAEAAAVAAAEQAAAEAKARAERDAQLEARRLADLWTYHSVPVDKGRQRTAAIYSANNVDTDGQAPRAVQLVFRDHPEWGRSSYLVLQAGDFDCYGRCTVQVTVDETPQTAMAARRPSTDEAIAMFINDARTLWRLTDNATRISVDFPVKAGGTRTATFDVSGLDRSTLPGFAD